MKHSLSVLLISGLLFSHLAHAEDKTARNCEIFIKRASIGNTFHGSRSVETIIEIGDLAKDETVRAVGFRTKKEITDLGNAKGCNNLPPNAGQWMSNFGRPLDPNNKQFAFSFMINTVSITSECHGYNISHTGAFFVETNQNTYWLNPDLVPEKNFQFDLFAHGELFSKGDGSTTRSDMKYYNPAQCN